jgi:hypothetical protein
MELVGWLVIPIFVVHVECKFSGYDTDFQTALLSNVAVSSYVPRDSSATDGLCAAIR